MLVITGSILGQVKKIFVVEAVENLSLHSKQFELGQEVLK